MESEKDGNQNDVCVYKPSPKNYSEMLEINENEYFSELQRSFFISISLAKNSIYL